jgi:flagellar biosynthesis protein FlhG
MGDQAEKLREMMRKKGRGVRESQAGAVSEIQNRRSVPADVAGGPGEKQGREGKKTRIITITSGKGGVGKTNISVNMALAYARLGKKVVVMDADLGLANVNVILNMIPKFNLYHVIRKQKTMKEIMVDT